MKLLIEIPDEFISYYSNNKFTDFFERVKVDMNTLCGNYERETADMFIRAFAESRESQAVKTNADRIRAMSDEELAGFIRELNECCLAGAGMVDCSRNEDCIDCKGIVLEWLQSEVEE